MVRFENIIIYLLKTDTFPHCLQQSRYIFMQLEVLADGLQAVLKALGRLADPLHRRLASSFFDQSCINQCLILLEAFDQPPDAWVGVANKLPEPIIPSFTGIVGPVFVTQCGLVYVPELWFKLRLSSAQGHSQWSTRCASCGRADSEGPVNVRRVEVVQEILDVTGSLPPDVAEPFGHKLRW